MQVHGDAAPIADLARDREGAFVECASGGKLATRIGDIPETVEGARDAPAITQPRPDCERFVMSRLGRRIVALS